MENDDVCVCPEKQHDFRNSVQSLEGWILELLKDGKINESDRDVGINYLKDVAVCSKLDKLGDI